MNLVLGTHTLGLGGSETYLVTLADELQRLGHHVVLGAFALEEGASLARSRGIAEVVSLDGELPAECDGIVAQDSASAFELTRRYPSAPAIFVAHSEEYDEQLPPQLAGLVGAVVALNDRVERRVRALAADLRVVRLAQPVDVKRFRPAAVPSGVARRLLLLGNNGNLERAALVADVAAELGLDVVRVGAHDQATLAPELAIGDADIVMGYGRCVLEAMACGRPAYVYDHLGGDGWVTPETYPAIEADGFGGRALATVVDRDRLARDLLAYDPDMGLANRDLAVAHHRAEHHAQAIVDVLESFPSSRRIEVDSLGEMSRLVRAQWAVEARASRLAAQAAHFAARASQLEAINADLQQELDAARTEAADVAAQWEALTRSRRYRTAVLLARPVDAVRGRVKGSDPT